MLVTILFLILHSFLLTNPTEEKLNPTVLFAPETVTVQDYPSYPIMDAIFEKAVVKLNFNEEANLLQGSVLYTFTKIRNDVNLLRLHSFRSQINSISLNGANTKFTLHNDTLFIETGNLESGKESTLEIVYETDLAFGIIQTPDFQYWTSSEPYATAHYLPGYIHPRNQIQIDTEFNLPSKYEVVAPGKLVSENQNADNTRKTVRFSSNSKISITDFKFAFGNFKVDEVQYGIKKIRLFYQEKGLTKEEKQSLLNNAYAQLKSVEVFLNQEYPYAAFTCIVLPDTYWENKTYAASMGFVYSVLPDKDMQLYRTIIAQWFGVKRQAEQRKFSKNDFHWQAWVLARLLSQESSKHLSFNSDINARFSSNWNEFATMVNRFLLPENEFWFNVYKKSVTDVLGSNRSILLPSDYKEWLYVNSGLVFDSLNVATTEKSIEPETVIVTADWDGKGSLQLYLETKYVLEELLDLELVLIHGKNRTVKKLAISNPKDVIMVKAPMSLSNIYVNSVQPTWNVKLTKPMDFWLAQLRNEKVASSRLNAAKALIADTSNPDLQLIINDLLKSEKEPEVRSELILLYASLTKGATGTDMMIMDQYNKGEPAIKAAALKAFSFFPENEQMISIAQSVLKSTKSDSTFKSIALKTLASIMPDSTLQLFLSDFVLSNYTNEALSLEIMPILVNKADSSMLRYVFPKLITNRNSFAIREQALVNYAKIESNKSVFNQDIEPLFSDEDPRIRYVILDFLFRFETEKQSQLLENRCNNEYDFRVLQKVTSLKTSVDGN